MVNHSSFVKKLSNLYPNNTIDQMEHAALSMAVNATDENGDYIAFSFYENNGKVYLTDLGDVLFASHHEDFVKKLADKLGITFNEGSKSFELEVENLGQAPSLRDAAPTHARVPIPAARPGRLGADLPNTHPHPATAPRSARLPSPALRTPGPRPPAAPSA